MAACRTGDRDEHKGGPVSRRDCDCHSRVNFKQPGNILWSVEADGVTCFVARDHTGQQLAYIYFEDEPGPRSAVEMLIKD